MRILGLTSSVVLALTLAASPAMATNGYMSHGYGTVSKGMAGSPSATNPPWAAACSCVQPT